jgi:hypothetical protein
MEIYLNSGCIAPVIHNLGPRCMYVASSRSGHFAIGENYPVQALKETLWALRLYLRQTKYSLPLSGMEARICDCPVISVATKKTTLSQVANLYVVRNSKHMT